MLGSLAKWLLILGYDALYLRKGGGAVLVARARAEHRILVTRDRRLTERRLARPFLLIGAERVIDQLREVVAAFDLHLDEERILSRCLRCNAPTLPIGAEAVRQEVPAYVLETQPGSDAARPAPASTGEGPIATGCGSVSTTSFPGRLRDSHSVARANAVRVEVGRDRGCRLCRRRQTHVAIGPYQIQRVSLKARMLHGGPPRE